MAQPKYDLNKQTTFNLKMVTTRSGRGYASRAYDYFPATRTAAYSRALARRASGSVVARGAGALARRMVPYIGTVGALASMAHGLYSLVKGRSKDTAMAMRPTGGHMQTVVAKRTTGTKIRKRKRKTSKKARKKSSKKIKKTGKNTAKVEVVEYTSQFMYPGTSPVTGNSNNGFVSSNINYACDAFISFMDDTTMNNLFTYGESATKGGVLDPPALRGVPAASVENRVKAREKLMIDKYDIEITIANTDNTKFQLWWQEYVCNKSSDVEIITRAWKTYNGQVYSDGLETATSVDLSVANPTTLFRLPGFQMKKIPGFSQYWKLGRAKGHIELLPGEEIKIILPYSKIVWDKHKLGRDGETNIENPAYYHKGISRFLHLRSLSGVGRDSNGADGGFKSVLPVHAYNFRVQHRITLHRMDFDAPMPKQYYANLPGVVSWTNGTTQTSDYSSYVAPVGPPVQFSVQVEPVTGDYN